MAQTNITTEQQQIELREIKRNTLETNSLIL